LKKEPKGFHKKCPKCENMLNLVTLPFQATMNE
jgi:hypothetical protein